MLCVFDIGEGVGRGGKGGGERLCIERDLREGNGGGASPLAEQLWLGEEDVVVFVTNEQSCKTQQKPC